MDPLLYLDTARLGLMSPRAREAMYSLYAFAGDEGISARFVSLLQEGIETWPAAFRQRYRGLSDWHGIAEFKLALAQVLCLAPAGKVFLANRSAQLVRLSARLLACRCKRVLVTDLEWPGYLEILRQEEKQGGATLVPVGVRPAILREGASADEVAAHIASQYVSRDCDGLFLAAVNNLGIRLPVRTICETARRTRPPAFTVIDGAQAYCHSPETLEPPCCDFFIAGCHKWLGAFHPMGLAFCAGGEAQELARRTLQGLQEAGELLDPLLAFVTDLEDRNPGAFSETVSLSSLFSGRAALEDCRATEQHCAWATLLRNNEELAAAVQDTGWRPLRPAAPLRSGILLLEAERAETRAAEPAALSSRFLEMGVALSAYGGGLLRLSAPRRPWVPSEMDRLRTALKAAA